MTYQYPPFDTPTYPPFVDADSLVFETETELFYPPLSELLIAEYHVPRWVRALKRLLNDETDRNARLLNAIFKHGILAGTRQALWSFAEWQEEFGKKRRHKFMGRVADRLADAIDDFDSVWVQRRRFFPSKRRGW